MAWPLARPLRCPLDVRARGVLRARPARGDTRAVAPLCALDDDSPGFVAPAPAPAPASGVLWRTDEAAVRARLVDSLGTGPPPPPGVGATVLPAAAGALSATAAAAAAAAMRRLGCGVGGGLLAVAVAPAVPCPSCRGTAAGTAALTPPQEAASLLPPAGADACSTDTEASLSEPRLDARPDPLRMTRRCSSRHAFASTLRRSLSASASRRASSSSSRFLAATALRLRSRAARRSAAFRRLASASTSL